MATKPRNKRVAKLSHVDARGRAQMVDVGAKPITQRVATAGATIRMRPATLRSIRSGQVAKGEVFAVARVAGIQAAKRTAELIPLCHPLPIEVAGIEFRPRSDGRLDIEATVAVSGKTGVEMEALTAVSVAALTVYDMCKAVDRGMTIDAVRVLEKRGGRSGTWKR
jgi:cyclic pyranopterin monophosphate synthase